MTKSNREIAQQTFKLWEKNWWHGMEMTIPARDAFLESFTAALDEKDIRCERDIELARSEGIMQGVRR